MKKLHTILVFAQDGRGVLERISMLIRKKMYNLEQITASDTEKPGIKRLTISFTHPEDKRIPQIITQMQKITEVIEVNFVDPKNSIQREVGIFKIQRPENLSDLIALCDIFDGKVVYTTHDYVIVEVTGSHAKIHDFYNLIDKFKILEFGSSGSVAMER